MKQSRGWGGLNVRRLVVALVLLCGGTVQAQKVFDVGAKILSDPQANVLSANMPQTLALAPVAGKVSTQVPLAGVDLATAGVILVNEKTGRRVVLSGLSSCCPEIVLTPLLVAELKQSVLGEADTYMCMVVEKLATDTPTVKRRYAVSAATDGVKCPVFNYGPKDNVKTTTLDQRRLIRISQRAPMYHPADGSPETLAEIERLTEANKTYVYEYELPDGAIYTYQPRIEPLTVYETITVGDFTVDLTYVFSTEQKTAIQFALQAWSDKLSASAELPIRLELGFASLSGGTLAQASTSFLSYSGRAYPVSVFNHIMDYDADPGNPDFSITFNSNFSFSYGSSGSCPAGFTDFVTVFLHEVAHGLGFAGAINSDGSYLTGYPSKWAEYLYYNGSTLNTMTDSGRYTAIRSTALYWDGPNAKAANGGSQIEMYAPSTYAPGSSVSHWDSSVTFTTFMKYSVAAGTYCRTINDREAKLLKDVGWTLVGSAAPSAPTGVSATDGASTLRVVVSWAASAGATGYEVYRNTTDDSSAASKLASLAGTSYTNSTATPGVLYYYWVKAANSFGASAFSVSDSGYRRLPAPTGVVASDASTNDVTVVWNAVAGASYYRVRRETLATGTWAELGSWQTTRVYVDTSAEAGTEYCYYVGAAVDGSGSRPSAYSASNTGIRRIPVTVTFDVHGGEALYPAEQTLLVGLSYGSLPVPIRAGYRFSGWWTGIRGTGAEVRKDTLVASPTNHTLYARWVSDSEPIVEQAAKLIPNEGYGYFGNAVAISGDSVIIGASIGDSGKGAAHIYVREATNWVLQARLVASDGVAGDNYGVSVAISGDTVVVGANGADFYTGAAYVYVRQGTNWVQQAKLSASDGSTGDGFGYSVAISGDRLVAGALEDDSSKGSAYVYVRQGTDWAEEARLVASDGVAWDNFGVGVTISGDTVAVGASSATLYSGAAYVYVRQGSAWSQQARLGVDDAQPDSYFGASLSVSADTLIVGAPWREGGGSAFVFVRQDSSWSRQATLLASDGATDDVFGCSVWISGDAVAVGACYDDESGYNSGSAYLFRRQGSNWLQQAKLTASDGSVWAEFGCSVAISDDTLVAGAYSDGAYGSAYIFTAKYPLPEAVVEGNGEAVIDGDTTPSEADHTDFGRVAVTGGTVSRTFTIRNTGTTTLHLNGVPVVSVSGPPAAEFTVTEQPAATVFAGMSTTFTVQFAPTTVGLRTAALSIVNDDADEAPYDFMIQGLGLEQDAADYEYSISNGVASITRYIGAGGNVTLPLTIEGCPVKVIGNQAFWQCESLVSVAIPNGVTNIGHAVFYNCTNLTSVSISATVTSMGDGVFDSCDGLTNIAVSAANPAYSSTDGVLFNKDGTLLVSYPGGKHGEYQVPEGTTRIGDGAFYYRRNLTGVVFPGSLAEIGAWAFASCTSLSAVTVQDSVAMIGYYAFSECVSLTNVAIGAALIGDYAFSSCYSLSTVRIDGGRVGAYQFHHCVSLVNVSIGHGVTEIGDHAFEYCYGLAEVTIPESVTNIGEYAFLWSGLTNAVIGSASIDALAFASCDALASVSIGNTVRDIGPSAFSGCRSLADVSIPNSVTNIGNGAFAYCGLTNAVIDAAFIGGYAFFVCENLACIVFGGGVKDIGENGFGSCTSLRTITIPDGVLSIGGGAFEWCGLTNAVVGTGVAWLGDYAFAWCGELAALYFKGDVPELGGVDVFWNSYPTVYTVAGRAGWLAELAGRPTAVWTSTAGFDAGVGTPSFPAQTYNVGNAYGQLPTASRTGCAFRGWRTALDGSGLAVTTNSLVPYVTSDHTLYAEWAALDPVISPTNGTVFNTAAQKVTLSCATTGAEIRYTTNGVDPTINSALYSKSFNIYATTTVKARAFMPEMLESDVAASVISKYVSLAEALNIPGLTVTTDGVSPWTAQAGVTRDGFSAARSGMIGNNGATWMQTAVSGAGTASFWWKASCEDDDYADDWDYLVFLVDGSERQRLDGITGWIQVTVALGAGEHTLRWEYRKDSDVLDGEDCGWVDQVVWTPTGGSTTTTEVPVPFTWLDTYGLVTGGNYEAAALADADGDGYLTWQEYVAGSSPTNGTSKFQARIGMTNGSPFVTWTPDLGAARQYTVEGKSSLTNVTWISPTNAAARFFRVKVSME